jgi:RimJ/RimL family protein N-acetyltransferase
MEERMIKIELEPFTKSDIRTLINWVDSPELLLQCASGFSYPLDGEQVERHLAHASETLGTTRELRIFKAVDVESHKSVGHIELARINRENGSARVVRVLVGPRELRGRGTGTQMMREILRIGFLELGLHRIDLFVFDFNQNAIACYERVGFRKEGLLRQTLRVGDQYWNVYLMSILEPEWQER